MIMRTHLPPGRYDLINKNDLTSHRIEQESEKLNQCESIIRARSIPFFVVTAIYFVTFFFSLNLLLKCNYKEDLQFEMIIKLISILVLIQAARSKPQVSWHF